MPKVRFAGAPPGSALIAALVCAAGVSAILGQSDPAVTVTGGQVKGRALPGGAVFKGIPYAAAPVGDLRWKEPMAVKPWNGVREAAEYGAPCAQIAAGWNDKIAAAGSEDCLFLNIWTAEWPVRTRHPVMFWIHGGANMGGSAMGAAGIEPPFDAERLSRRGVVVVTINYRLGMFGFIAHPELTAESPHHASGNYGILDQIAALKWVRDNIAKFGGDPANVTVFGQSAGAHDAGLLMTSPLAKGLFRHAIEESGTVMIGGNTTPPLAQLERAGVKLAEKMKAPATGTIRHLRVLSTAEVLKSSPPYSGGGPLRPEPNVDGYVLPKVPAEMFRAGEETAIPLVIGNNGRERATSGGAEGLKKAIQDVYGSRAQQALELYAEASSYPPYGDINVQYGTDMQFRCPAVLIANWHSAKNATYEYEFTRAYEPRGAVHSWELQYVFGNLSPQAADPMDRTLSDQVQEYWTNFAKTGNPNGGTLVNWPKHDARAGAYLEFAAGGPAAKEALRRPFCELFAQNLAAKR
jgi:para-nitrobenzyl esterase